MKTQDLSADGEALPDSGFSDAIRAAQNRLLELRRQLGVSQVARGELPVPSGESQAATCHLTPAACYLPPAKTGQPQGVAPTVVPYFSEPLTRHLQAAAARRGQREKAGSREWLTEIRDTKYEIGDSKCEVSGTESGIRDDGPDLETQTPSLTSRSAHLESRISYLVRVYPDIALAMLRRKLAAPGRVWLLLRHYDMAGRGRLPLDEAASLLTGGDSPLRICGRRQLGNLLDAGEGVFWQRDTARDGRVSIRLHSAARAAANLGVARLGGSPVAVPLAALTGSIGDVRAHLYASFHSGRQRRDFLTGETRPRGPIARSTMTTLSAAAANSQRNYERRAGVRRKTSFAVGPRLGATDEHETAWARGRALFHLHDRSGRFGRPGAVYLAWQLPNEYTGPHAQLPRGRLKRHNRALADLFVDGMTGNSEQHPVMGTKTRRFFGTAKAASLSRAAGEKYWRNGGAWLWQPEIGDTKYEIGDTKYEIRNTKCEVHNKNVETRDSRYDGQEMLDQRENSVNQEHKFFNNNGSNFPTPPAISSS